MIWNGQNVWMHHVFGRDPYVASDLLQGPIDVTAATQPLYDSGAERSTAIRMAARKAALELQDSDDLRRALAARPRPAKKFEVGWRTGVEARVKVSSKVERDGTAEQLWLASKVTISSYLIGTIFFVALPNRFGTRLWQRQLEIRLSTMLSKRILWSNQISSILHLHCRQQSKAWNKHIP